MSTARPGVIGVTYLGTPHDTLVAMAVVTTVCDKDFYRYGHQTMVKVNEIAGVGNHYTSLYGEMTPQDGQRWNQDPGKPLCNVRR
jgi:hypothetical protein